MAHRLDQNRAWLLSRARTLLLILLSLLLAGVGLLSFHWKFGYDTAQMLYYGRLISQLHFVPYRDIFEENLPGAILAYTTIGNLIDYSNPFLLRVFDLFYLTAISLATWRWLTPLRKQVAWAAIALFGLVYLLGGPGFSTQREYVFLLPVVIALAVATSSVTMPDPLRALIVGLLLGVAANIKPHAGIGLLPVTVFHYAEIRARGGGFRPSARAIAGLVVAYAIGVIIPLAAVLAYLALSGGLPAWVEIVTRYWPLYATTTGDMTVLTGVARLQFIAARLVTLGGQAAWLIPASVGVGAALWPGACSVRRRRQVVLMVGLTIAYALYPALTGQFYPQHWLPLTFFLMALSALCFLSRPRSIRLPAEALALAAVVIALALRGDLLLGGVNQLADFYIRHQPIPSIDGDRAAEIAAYLDSALRPGDTVQPLDAVGYAMHGMLIARATPATRFQADAPFYTQPDSPYIQGLRAEFIDALNSRPPRFLIDVVARVRLQRSETVPPFPELDRLMHDRYSLIYVGHGFLIYEIAGQARPGVIAYPSEFSGMSPEEIAPFTADLLTFAEGKPAAKVTAMAQRLAIFGAAHASLYYENLGDTSESARQIETWLNRHAYKVGEQRIVGTRLLNYLSPRQPCAAPRPVETPFGDVIHLRAAAVTLLSLDPGQFVCVRMEMAAAHTPLGRYLMSAHLVDIAGRLVAQYDSQPVGNLLPTTDWQPGQSVSDQFALRLPDGLPPGDYSMRLYLSDVETLEPLRTAGGLDFATIGTIRVGPTP